MKKIIFIMALFFVVMYVDAYAADNMKIFFCVGTEKY